MAAMSDLSDVRELLSDPARWTTRADARDANGMSIPYDSDKAVCWCLMGAVYRVFPASYRDEPWRTLKAALGPKSALSQFNDSATHADVMALIDRAISRAASEETP